jgi:hypothetical protein
VLCCTVDRWDRLLRAGNAIQYFLSVRTDSIFSPTRILRKEIETPRLNVDTCLGQLRAYTYSVYIQAFFFLEFIFPLLHRIVRHGHIPLRYFFCSRCGDNPCWRKSDFLNHGAPSGWAQCCIFSPVSRALKRAAASSKVRIGARRRARKKLRAHVYMYIHTKLCKDVLSVAR